MFYRKHQRKVHLFILLSLLLFPAKAIQAETRYISDFLIINIRDSIEQPFQVITTVQSNDPVIVLEEQGNYLKVKTENGHIGWISAQYVKSELPKTLQIKNLKEKIQQLKESLRTAGQLEFDQLADPSNTTPSISVEKYDKLRAERDALVAEIDSLEKQLQQKDVASNNTSSTDELSQAFNELQEKYNLLLEQNEIGVEPLLAQIAEKENLLSQLRQENRLLKKNKAIFWFCAGASVFLLGILSGKILGRRKKRFTY